MEILYAIAFLLPFGLCATQRTGTDCDRSIVRLVRALEERYNIVCTTILYKGNEAEVHYRALRLAKTMMSTHSAYGCIAVSSIERSLEVFHDRQKQEIGCTRLFYLILADEDFRMKEDIAQLSQKLTLTGMVWLVFLNENVSIFEFFAEVNTAFDMDLLTAQPFPNGSLKLSEVYRVSMEHPVRVLEYGLYSEAEGLQSSVSTTLPARRQNMEGIVLNVATKRGAYVEKNGEVHIRGIFGSLWREMEKKLNFSSRYWTVNETGLLHQENQWSGMIGLMLREKMDAGIGEVTMSPERCAAIHCLRPIVITRNQLYFKKTRMRLRWDAILKPFHANTWIAILFWIFFSSISLNLCFRIGKRYHLENVRLDFNLTNSVTSVFSALCQQGSYMVPESTSCRILFFTSYVVSCILFTLYSATLTSYITVQQPWYPFENLEQLLKDGTYKLQMVKNTASHAYFANATNPFVKEVFEKLVATTPEDSLPKDYDEAMRRVCRNEKIVFFGSEFKTARAFSLINKSGRCEIIRLEKPLNQIYITILLRKNSQYKNVFDFHMDSLKYYGFLERIVNVAWTEMRTRDGEEMFQGVGIVQVSQMYAVLIFGIFLSLALLLLEVAAFELAKRWKSRKALN